MALDKATLESDIQAILDAPPANHADFASGVCDAIDSYLANIEMDEYPAAGVNPSSTPDPSFQPSKVTPVPALKTAAFRTAFVAAVNAAFAGARDFSACTAAFVTDISTIAATNDEGGYAGTGATVCPAGPDVHAALDKGLEELEAPEGPGALAKELAKQIHTATTSSTHTGTAYNKGAFAGSGHSSSLK